MNTAGKLGDTFEASQIPLKKLSKTSICLRFPHIYVRNP